MIVYISEGALRIKSYDPYKQLGTATCSKSGFSKGNYFNCKKQWEHRGVVYCLNEMEREFG